MKTLRVALLALMALTAPANSQELTCYESYDAVIDSLITTVGEYLIKAYKFRETARVEFHVSEGGSWTALLVTEENLTCLIGIGEDLNVNKADLAIIKVRVELGI